jgi:glycosyltransferase involved in cell wall biosynthesis
MHIAFYPEDAAPEEMLGLKRIISKVTNKIDRIIAISNAAQDTLIKSGVQEEKITTIYNGNVDRYSFINFKDDDIPVVGFVGRLSLEKGPDILIDSIRIIKERTSSLEFKVCIVGDGSMEQALKDKVIELKLEKMVEFKGYSAEPYREMNKFRVMVVPSRCEGLGLVILEAMNLGIPVIGALVGGIPEAVIDGETGLLVPNEDPNALAIAIELLLKDAEKCQKFGKQARSIWEEKFSLNVFTNNHLDLYQSLINEVDKSVSSGKNKTPFIYHEGHEEHEDL